MGCAPGWPIGGCPGWPAGGYQPGCCGDSNGFVMGLPYVRVGAASPPGGLGSGGWMCAFHGACGCGFDGIDLGQNGLLGDDAFVQGA